MDDDTGDNDARVELVPLNSDGWATPAGDSSGSSSAWFHVEEWLSSTTFKQRRTGGLGDLGPCRDARRPAPHRWRARDRRGEERGRRLPEVGPRDARRLRQHRWRTILVGVDEGRGFEVVELANPARHRDDLVALASDAITPPLRITTQIVPIEGHHVVVAEVPRLPDVDRPAYVTSKGLTTGAYLRTGDGDRRMTEGEIGLLYGSRTQPLHDQEALEGTSTADLDPLHLNRVLQRVAQGSPKLRGIAQPLLLHRLGILAEPNDDAPLTLADYLAYGEYPQQRFPQLMVSFVVLPPENSAAALEGRVPFLDNVTVRGAIPDLVNEALTVVRRNLAARGVMSDRGRRDQLEYPMEAIREALVNAVLHRDYSALSRGTQIQVVLHPDRLEIRSPGGLYGA